MRTRVRHEVGDGMTLFMICGMFTKWDINDGRDALAGIKVRGLGSGGRRARGRRGRSRVSMTFSSFWEHQKEGIGANCNNCNNCTKRTLLQMVLMFRKDKK